MKAKHWFFTRLAFVVWVSYVICAAAAQPPRLLGEDKSGGNEGEARQILDAANFKGGLIVHIGCADGKLTAALHAGEGCLVHGLDTDARNIKQARAYIRSRNLYGPVSVERFDGEQLPYADNLVNVAVSEDLGDVPMTEVMRVLCPHGVAYIKRGNTWTRTVKPRPDEIDEWTHFLHDASGNAVARDQVVGPPRYVQWIAEPRHARSHEHTPSINALVSAGGRIFYVADEGLIASIQRSAKWHLVARDAYNGTLLWKRPIGPWFPHIVNWGVTPSHLQRRLVADGNRIYVTLGLHAPLSAVDATTGETLKVYERTRGTEEVVFHKGVLLLAVRSVTEKRAAELAKWAQLERQKKSPLYDRETAQPLVHSFRAIERRADKTVLALDADTGRVLWKKAGKDAAGLRAVTLCASGDRVFYQNGRDVVCLELTTGRQVWSVPSSALRVVATGPSGPSSVVCADGRNVTALSAETGKTVWTQPGSLTQIRDMFVVNGSLWVGGFKPIEGKRGPAWGPYFVTQRDLATGKILMHIEPENPGHHHRCWRNKATERYILAGRRGVEFIDLKSGDYLWHSWVRGVCKYGVMPCNGLLYAPPHACGCYIAAKLTGFYALASARTAENKSQGSDRLEKGPAYRRSEIVAKADEWPTYRHDARRSGCTPCPVPAVLHRRWQADVGGRLTSPTIAGGKVFVASVDEHRVCAIDADSGRESWDFTAGARVDSPPTVYANRAIFGCRDGCVYSLRASDGALAWRLRAARSRRRVAACGQLESASPINGSVLVQDGAAYFTAGRSSYLDGGIDLYRVQAQTGKVLSRTQIYSPDPETGRQPDQYGPAYMPGALGEILTSDDQYVYLRDMVLNKHGDRQKEGNPHLFTLTGFLDGSWPHRSYWIFGTKVSLATGCSGRDRNLMYGRLLVVSPAEQQAPGQPMLYGYGRANVHWSNQLQDGAYRLFALNLNQRKEQWSKRVPIQVRAMVLADSPPRDKVLFVVGPVSQNNGAVLVAISATDGSELARYKLDCAPVFDGMAAADGRLYLSLADGRVLCMAGQRQIQAAMR
jgi:outer membrane protein assembly factor BamB/2-polyprenyl-3-methyl-5-hydroxy-6-metoxy-1,4-benzoquinol methylase